MNAEGSGRKPHYHLKALDKATDVKGKVGAAWRNDDGSISIRLDPFVVLAHSPNLVLTLFDAEFFDSKKQRKNADDGKHFCKHF